MVGMNNISSAMGMYTAFAKKADDKKAEADNRVENTQDAQKAKKTEDSQVKLSSKAQALLDKIKEKYSGMDIFVADFSSEKEAQDILSRGSQEFSILFSPDELEKMADDDDYAESQMGRIDDAIAAAKEISEKYSEDSEEGGESVVTRIGISINSDGTTTMFAELEKASERQRERIEEAAQKRAEEKEKEEKAAQDQEAQDASGVKPGYTNQTRRATVKADNPQDLLKQIQEFDWSEVKKQDAFVGGRFDLSI